MFTEGLVYPGVPTFYIVQTEAYKCALYHRSQIKPRRISIWQRDTQKMCQASRSSTPKMHFKQIIFQTRLTTLLVPWGRLQKWWDNNTMKVFGVQQKYFVAFFTSWSRRHPTLWRLPRLCYLQHSSPLSFALMFPDWEIPLVSSRCHRGPGCEGCSCFLDWHQGLNGAWSDNQEVGKS